MFVIRTTNLDLVALANNERRSIPRTPTEFTYIEPTADRDDLFVPTSWAAQYAGYTVRTYTTEGRARAQAIRLATRFNQPVETLVVEQV